MLVWGGEQSSKARRPVDCHSRGLPSVVRLCELLAHIRPCCCYGPCKVMDARELPQWQALHSPYVLCKPKAVPAGTPLTLSRLGYAWQLLVVAADNSMLYCSTSQDCNGFLLRAV